MSRLTRSKESKSSTFAASKLMLSPAVKLPKLLKKSQGTFLHLNFIIIACYRACYTLATCDVRLPQLAHFNEWKYEVIIVVELGNDWIPPTHSKLFVRFFSISFFYICVLPHLHANGRRPNQMRQRGTVALSPRQFASPSVKRLILILYKSASHDYIHPLSVRGRAGWGGVENSSTCRSDLIGHAKVEVPPPPPHTTT